MTRIFIKIGMEVSGAQWYLTGGVSADHWTNMMSCSHNQTPSVVWQTVLKFKKKKKNIKHPSFWSMLGRPKRNSCSSEPLVSLFVSFRSIVKESLEFFFFFLHTLLFKRAVQLAPRPHNGPQCPRWWEPVFIRGTPASRSLTPSPVRRRWPPSAPSAVINLPPAPRRCPTSRPDKDDWHTSNVLWAGRRRRGRSRTRAAFNEPGSQGQNKGRAGVLGQRNNVLTTASAETLGPWSGAFYVGGFTALTGHEWDVDPVHWRNYVQTGLISPTFCFALAFFYYFKTLP